MDKPLVTLLTDAAPAPVYYSTYASAYGELVLLTTEKGICGLHFLEQSLAYYLQLAEKELGCMPILAPEHTQSWWDCMQQATKTLPLVVAGTPFQVSVWEVLCTIPAGTTRSYQAIARQLGLGQGARAVGNALAQNFVGWLIPCHRVVRQDGQLGGYRWGEARKKALLAGEALR